MRLNMALVFVFILCFFLVPAHPGSPRQGPKTVVVVVIFVFLLFCVLVFLGYCYFILSVPVQLIAWKDRPRNDLLCVERDIKQLLTHSLTSHYSASAAGTLLRFFKTISENTSFWQLKPLVTLSTYRHYTNNCIYLSIYYCVLKD